MMKLGQRVSTVQVFGMWRLREPLHGTVCLVVGETFVVFMDDEVRDPLIGTNTPSPTHYLFNTMARWVADDKAPPPVCIVSAEIRAEAARAWLRGLTLSKSKYPGFNCKYNCMQALDVIRRCTVGSYEFHGTMVFYSYLAKYPGHTFTRDSMFRAYVYLKTHASLWMPLDRSVCGGCDHKEAIVDFVARGRLPVEIRLKIVTY